MRLPAALASAAPLLFFVAVAAGDTSVPAPPVAGRVAAPLLPGNAAPSPVTVRLRVTRPLRIVRRRGGSTFEGVLSATVTNHSASSVRIYDLDTHGVAFIDSATGVVRHVHHLCDCVGMRTLGQLRAFTLGPNQTTTIRLDTWDCAAATPPPPGDYRVEVRLLDADRFEAQFADPHAPGGRAISPGLRTAMTRLGAGATERYTGPCEQALASPEMWRAAISSQAINVKLRNPGMPAR